MIHTETRTPTPAKITLAGENICQINLSAEISNKVMPRSVPGQYPLPESQRVYIGRSRSSQAIASIVHHFGTGLAPGLAPEGQREFHWEIWLIGAGQRGDGIAGRSLCASGMRREHC